MKKGFKLALSIPSLTGLYFFLSLWYPSLGNAIYYSMEMYNIQILTLLGLTTIQLLLLLIRLWQFENLNKSTKWEWTKALLFFNVISSLIYIWEKDEEFMNNEKKALAETSLTRGHVINNIESKSF